MHHSHLSLTPQMDNSNVLTCSYAIRKQTISCYYVGQMFDVVVECLD